MIERDLDAIPAAVREYRATHSSHDLFLAVARFAILAYAPSLHAKHAVIAALSAYEARDAYGARWDDLLAECARYAAESRQPWSEPPILDPPRVSADQRRDVNALREAVAARDRLAAERWLAARLDDDDLEHDLFTVAADGFDDLGMKVIVTAVACKLSRILGEHGRFAALRIAVWEIWSAARRADSQSAPDPLRVGPTSDLRTRLVANAVTESGSIESVQAVFLYDAAKDTNVFDRVSHYLATLPLNEAPTVTPCQIDPPIYRLARDFGQHLRAFASGDERLQSATAYNLEHAPSFADWSFA